MLFPFILIAFCAGLALATQAAINSQLANSLNGQPAIAALISFATGTLLLLVICWWRTDLSVLRGLSGISWWKLLGGSLGALVVFTTIFLAPKIGVTNMLFFIIIGQLIMALFIDHFGWLGMTMRPIQSWQLIGFIIIVFGLVVFFFGRQISNFIR